MIKPYSCRSSFTLSGSGTTPQGAITDYAWSQVSGPNNVVVNNSSSATTSVSGFAAGTYVFRLQVTNDAKLSATDEVTATVITESATAPVANAGLDQTIQPPASFFDLSGAGTTASGTITGYLWSLISGPNIRVIDNVTSATTSVSGFVAGTYSFQLLVTNSFGLSAKDTVVINIVGLQTLTLQPTNNPNEVHFALWGSTTETDPNAPDMAVQAWTKNAISYYTRSMFKFDLTSIPANATIVSAKLTLYSSPTPLNGDLVHANSGTDNSFFISRITGNWSAATVNWNNQPGTSNTDRISIPHTTQSFLDLVDIDVKNIVATMVSTNNYGFMMQLQNEVIYNTRIFCSSKYSDATKHPKLVITYQ